MQPRNEEMSDKLEMSDEIKKGIEPCESTGVLTLNIINYFKYYKLL